MLLFILLICVTANTKAQEITMRWSGYYQDDVRLGNKEIRQLMVSDEETNRLWNTSKDLRLVGVIAMTGAIGYWMAYDLDALFEPGSDQGLLYGALGFTAAGIGFGVLEANLRNKAILKFNKGLENEVSINISPTINGIGLVVQFGK